MRRQGKSNKKTKTKTEKKSSKFVDKHSIDKDKDIESDLVI